MIKNFNEFVKNGKLNENENNLEAEVITTETPGMDDMSPEELVRQMSDKLGIDISQYDVDDICSNINLEGLTLRESRIVVYKHLMGING